MGLKVTFTRDCSESGASRFIKIDITLSCDLHSNFTVTHCCHLEEAISELQSSIKQFLFKLTKAMCSYIKPKLSVHILNLCVHTLPRLCVHAYKLT